jgi:glycosyltransferase involved in cell wall biosynthesis
MRVVLVSNSLPPYSRGGAEAYVASLGGALAAAGHEVLVLAGHASDLDRVEVRTLPGLPELLPAAPLATKLLWHARDQWVPSVYRATVHELRAFRPDVVHTHECQSLSASVFSAIDRVGVPHVHTAHDMNLLCARVSMTKDGEFCGGRCSLCLLQRRIRGGIIGRHLKRLISVSEYIQRRHLAARIVTPERALVIRLGAAAPAARARALSGNGIRLGFIGAVARHKGIATLLAAIEAAPADCHLIIAGDGHMAQDVAARSRSDSRITFLGHIGGEDKERFFDSIDVLVVPSEWEEPAALVATEAIARGIPTIVSDRGGIPETPEARVFRSGSAEGLVAAVTAYVENPDEYAAASLRLVERHEEFSWQSHQTKVERVLHAAAEGH